MAAITTLFPVFFMLALGFVSHRMGWITPEQKAGVNSIIFTVLFPIMIFNLSCSASMDMSRVSVIGYVVAVYAAGIFLGRALAPFTGKRYAHISPFLLSVEEAGSVALPLHLAMVGESSNTVFFNLAGIPVGFLLMPILISRMGSKGASARDMAMGILTNSFVIAVVAGLAMNFSGAYAALMASPFAEMYTGTIANATAAIGPMIMFCLGYDFKVDRSTVVPLAKLALVKTAYFAVAILGFSLLFPALWADKAFMLAVVISFMAPSGSGVVPMISPLFRDEDDAAFASAFIPLYLVITLVVFTYLVVFVA